ASSLTNIDALAGWNTANVTNMSYMFYNASSLASLEGASGWDTTKLSNKTYMFEGIPESVTRPSWY
ncbi:MAG: DUF285 domain-containing protein, partial [Candidatus Saccharibacteria bacterium]|nr:DUF285 domain-containing protein [Candidatus Saccharibacteria bacterium]